jgi:hypothetical protein
MRFLPALLALSSFALAAPEPNLPGTKPLTAEGDLSAQMVDGINRWLAQETDRAKTQRIAHWTDASLPWDQFTAAEREKLRQCLGVVDERTPGAIERIAPAGGQPPAHPGGIRIENVRWPVFQGVYGEGVLLLPPEARAVVIVLADPDQLAACATSSLHLAAQGCAVLMPTLLDRQDTWSGSAAMGSPISRTANGSIGRRSSSAARPSVTRCKR